MNIKATQLAVIEKAIDCLKEAHTKLEADESPQSALHECFRLVYVLIYVQLPSTLFSGWKAALERAFKGDP